MNESSYYVYTNCRTITSLWFWWDPSDHRRITCEFKTRNDLRNVIRASQRIQLLRSNPPSHNSQDSLTASLDQPQESHVRVLTILSCFDGLRRAKFSVSQAV